MGDPTSYVTCNINKGWLHLVVTVTLSYSGGGGGMGVHSVTVSCDPGGIFILHVT